MVLFHNLSLRARICLLMLCIVLASLWSLTLYASASVQREMQAMIAQQQTASARRIADGVEQELVQRLGALQALARQVPPLALQDTSAARGFWAGRPGLDAPINSGIALVNLRGSVVGHNMPDSDRWSAKLVNDAAVTQALVQGRAAVGQVQPQSQELVMAAPVRDAGGAVVGAVVGTLQLQNAGFLDALGQGPDGDFWVLEPVQRTIVAASNGVSAMKAVPAPGESPVLDRFLGGTQVSGVFVNSQGVAVLAAVHPVPTAQWLVALWQPTERAFAPVHAMQIRLGVAAILLSVLALLLTRWTMARQMAPALGAIAQLAQRLELVHSESTPAPLDAGDRSDEIGRLISAFNRLLQTLVQRKTVLREVLNTSNVGIFSTDSHDRITLVNETMGRLFGYVPERLIGLAYSDLLAPSERQKVQSAAEAEPRQSIELTRRLVRADGSEFWGHVSVRMAQPGVDGVQGTVGVITDISAQVDAHDYELFHRRMLELLARNTPLSSALEAIVRGVEELRPAALCSLQLLQSDGKHMAAALAPSLPSAFNAAWEGLEIGPYAASCGAAAFTNSRVLAHDLQIHGNWAAYRDLVAQFGLRACWAQPLRGHDGAVLGTIALYHRTPQSPHDADIALLEQAAHLASLAIAQHRSVQALQDSETRYRTMIEWSPHPLAVHRNGIVVYVNPAAVRLMAAESSQDMVGRSILDFVHPQSRSLVVERARRVAQTGQDLPPVAEKYLRLDGGTVDVEAVATKIVFDGAPAVLVSMQDMTQRNQSQRRLLLAAQVFDNAREGIMVTDFEGQIVEVNAAFTRITGFERDDVLGQNPRILNSGRQPHAYYTTMWQTLRDTGNWTGEVWNRRKGGEIYAALQTISTVHDAQGRAVNYVSLFSDITTAKEHAQYIERIAHFDALTNLPNRVLLADRLHQAMAQAQRRGLKTGVAFLDLDGFKGINDRYGHNVGDHLLVALATHMRQALREGDTLARLGGDEFVAVLVDLGETQACVPLLTRLLEAAAQTIVVDGHALQVSASLGVSFFPQADEVDADQLLRQADQAMYQAKLSGKNRYHVFDAEQDRNVRDHHENLDRIRNALDHGEFVLYYQPKVNMRSGAVLGAEALIRWQHPQQGLLSPAAFLPVVEGYPLAVDIGEWVLQQAMLQLAQWAHDGLRWSISVNIGARQLQQPNFVERLQALLDSHPSVYPQQLALEVLETSALEDLAHVSQVISACAALGVEFALDDFGTGYSSLSYLKRLPASLLKIDQSFVRDMLDDPDDLAILDGVIGLATAFRRDVIAEGVESLAHGTLLLQLGCELGQGYGIARPMPATQFPAWAQQWTPDQTWQNALRVHREDMVLLYVSVEHRAWCAQIEAFVRGSGQALTAAQLRECRFDRWLNREGSQRYGAHPVFVLMDTLHERLHGLACKLHALAEKGQVQEAIAALPELHAMEGALAVQIQRLLAPIKA